MFEPDTLLELGSGALGVIRIVDIEARTLTIDWIELGIYGQACPDCRYPVESHKLFRDGRCPVVRVPGTPQVPQPDA